MLFVILRFCELFCFFACLPLCACHCQSNSFVRSFVCQSVTNGSFLYDHAKYVILLVKVKIVLNSNCNLKL